MQGLFFHHPSGEDFIREVHWTMMQTLVRLVGFTAAASLTAYCILIIAGSIVTAHAAGVGSPIVVRDQLQGGEHQLSGMVMVQSRCDELSVITKTVSPVDYVIVFTTWREPSVSCSDEQTPRYFSTTLNAPAAGVNFTATLDGQALPIGVVTVVPKRPQ